MIPEIMEIIIRVISKEREYARKIVESIIDSEQNYLFTNDQEYKDNRSEIVRGETELPGGGGGPQDGRGPPDQRQQIARGGP